MMNTKLLVTIYWFNLLHNAFQLFLGVSIEVDFCTQVLPASTV